MQCTACDAKAKCRESRPRRGGFIVYRRYFCPSCRHRFSTFELVVRELPAIRGNQGGGNTITRAELIAVINDLDWLDK